MFATVELGGVAGPATLVRFVLVANGIGALRQVFTRQRLSPGHRPVQLIFALHHDLVALIDEMAIPQRPAA